MPVARYNIPIQCKIRQGRMLKAPYLSLWGDASDDSDALAVKNLLDTYLANKAKCGVSKVIDEVSNEELASPETPEDVQDVKLRYRYKGNIGADRKLQSLWRTVIIPGLKIAITAAQIIAMIEEHFWTEDFNGDQHHPNEVQILNVTLVNVAAGGVASETIGMPLIGG